MNDNPHPIFRTESLERLSSPEQLDQLMQVVSSRSWLSLAALGSLVGLVLVWSVVGRIPILVTGRGVLVHPDETSRELLALTYFERREGDRIQPGMAMMIVPDVAGADPIGGIVGRVKSVAASPVTTLEMARQMDGAAQSPDVTEVLVELESDLSTASGYRWSSPAGKPFPLTAGMGAMAHVTLEQRSPLSLAFPFVR